MWSLEFFYYPSDKELKNLLVYPTSVACLVAMRLHFLGSLYYKCHMPGGDETTLSW